jgi:flavin-binding protein dodecin
MTGEGTKIYRKTELVGTSTVSFADATRRAVERAQKTLRNVEWFEVTEERGRVVGGQIEFQVALVIGFTLEDSDVAGQ